MKLPLFTQQIFYSRRIVDAEGKAVNQAKGSQEMKNYVSYQVIISAKKYKGSCRGIDRGGVGASCWVAEGLDLRGLSESCLQ